ncbi:MAG: inner membrane protein involved in colicin E2 resistance, partial [Gammaproteobacteria bacterium]
MEVKLAGSNEFNFVSYSPKTSINVDAKWGSPSFFGVYLPSC